MPDMTISRLEEVGEKTIALELEIPSDFKAFPGQFVLVKALIDGEEETGYYTISSPEVEETFETTVAVDPNGTLGPWLAERTVGNTITVEGPFGNIQYTGDEDVLVFAGGPGIGPAVGIGERAQQEGKNATIVYGGSNPPHAERLAALGEGEATVVLSTDLSAAIEDIEISTETVYVFGFEDFVEEVGKALSESSIDISNVEIENFGSE